MKESNGKGLFITEKTYYRNSNVDDPTAKTNCWTNRL
jgi:hypothetical protein